MEYKLSKTTTLQTSIDDILQAIDRLIISGDEVYATKHLGNTSLSKLIKMGESEWGTPSYKREPQRTYFVDEAKNTAWKTRVKVFIKNHFNDKTVSEYICDDATYSMWKTDYPKDVEKIIELLKTLKTQLQNKEVSIEMQNTNNSFNANAVSSTITKLQEFILQAKIIRQDEYQVPGKGIAMPDFISGPKYDKWMNSIKIFADRNLKEHELYENIIKTYNRKNSFSLSAFDHMLGYLETIKEDEAFFKKTQKGDDENMPFIDYSKDSVFIVHGHDNEAKERCARFLERIGLKPIILHEQPSSGKTIIEKIEKYSDVGFAIVLYTPCDDGKSKNTDTYNDRARQNVVFEHGYMIAKLGRDRVSALVKGSIETPGDISGVVYIKMDSGDTWKLALAKEMKDIGFDIDMNKI